MKQKALLSSWTQSKPLLIAEISSNHNRDLDRACALIEAANSAGATAVKFQLFELEKLFSREVLESSSQHRDRKSWELPRDFIPVLANKAHSLGLLFGCTPFDLDAARFVQPYVDFLKIASYEILWVDLIRACGGMGKSVIVSTGMANESEVGAAVTALRDSGCEDFALLHCVSSYPAPRTETNLRAIKTLRERFNVTTGWSDHSHDMSVVLRSISRWGASVIELHFDLDGEGAEAVGGHCWLPSELKALTTALYSEALLDGSGKKEPAESELRDLDWRADPSDGLRPLLPLRQKIGL